MGDLYSEAAVMSFGRPLDRRQLRPASIKAVASAGLLEFLRLVPPVRPPCPPLPAEYLNATRAWHQLLGLGEGFLRLAAVLADLAHDHRPGRAGRLRRAARADQKGFAGTAQDVAHAHIQRTVHRRLHPMARRLILEAPDLDQFEV